MSRSFLSTLVRIQREAERVRRAQIREAERQQRILAHDERIQEKHEQVWPAPGSVDTLLS